MKTATLLDIDQVNQLTGLPHATLRNWEKRYGFPRPHRSEGGHRLYDIAEVQNIRAVVELYKNGARVKSAIEEILKRISSNSLQSDSPERIAIPVVLNEEIREVLESLYRYDEIAAAEYLSRIGMRLAETDLLEMVYPQLLTGVGDDWENARINVAQEHFSWNFLRSRLLNFFKTNRSMSSPPKLILASPPGELHEGGLIILAAYMMLRGWKVYYLGVNLPVEDLAHAVTVINPDVVCISSLRSSSIEENWTRFENLNKAVVVGGPCVTPLKANDQLRSDRISFIQGDIKSSIAQIELILHSVSRKLR
ncbi:MAG: MerR family transcriptional regulator [Bdellovibrio sp.]